MADMIYEKGKRITWIIRIEGPRPLKDGGKAGEDCFTGVSLQSDEGLVIVTCARPFYDFDMPNTEVTVRRFAEPYKSARLKFIRNDLGLAMLQVNQQLIGNEYGELVVNGSLFPGQPLLYVGNLLDYAGSCLYGYVAFRCENIEFHPDNYTSCENYPSDRKEEAPLSHLNMGDLIKISPDKKKKKKEGGDVKLFEEELNPWIPVIQCDGFPDKACSKGGPIFNIEGNIVGILDTKFGGFYLAIHVAAIKAFLQIYSQHQGTSKRQGKRPKKGG